MLNKNAKIYVAGHRGMVGSAIVRALQNDGFSNIITKTSKELDLTNQALVKEFFGAEKPQFVFVAAAKVGGIYANNTFRADFIYQNLMIQNNIIHESYLNKVEKLLFLGSSCIYPKMATQPIKEEYLLDGKLENTNEPYAIAKIAGVKMCQAYREQYNCNFISAMPTNLYGKNDNYDLNNSHVLPALIRKFHEAKMAKAPFVEIWGTGTPRREFLYADDLADACLYLMQNYNNSKALNIGCGTDVSIKELAETIQKVVGYEGQLKFDTTKPDGTPRKLLDVSALANIGWTAKTDLIQGLTKTYIDYKNTLGML